MSVKTTVNVGDVGTITEWFERNGELMVRIWWDDEAYSDLPAPATYCKQACLSAVDGKPMLVAM